MEIPEEVHDKINSINHEIRTLKAERRQVLKKAATDDSLETQSTLARIEAIDRSIKDLAALRTHILDEYMPEPGSVHEAVRRAHFIRSGGASIEEEKPLLAGWPLAATLIACAIGFFGFLSVMTANENQTRTQEDNHAQPGIRTDRENAGSEGRQLPE